MSFNNIERVLGLHQRVQLLYIVNGYIASLEHEEGYPYPEIKGEPGMSIEEALKNLDEAIPSGRPKEWKK